jgi:hypothetical protein
MKKHACIAALAASAFALLAPGRAHAQAVQSFPRGVLAGPKTWTFDDPPSNWLYNAANYSYGGWFFTPNFDGFKTASYDSNGCCSESGIGNLWARSASAPWSAVNLVFYPGVWYAGGNYTWCDIDADIRTSTNFSGGIMDVWNFEQAPVTELLYDSWIDASSPQDPNYIPQHWGHVDVSKSTGAVLLDFGFHGTGTDQWLQVDNVQIICFNSDG